MFKIYYAGKRSIPECDEGGRVRTDYGNRMCDLRMGLSFFEKRHGKFDPMEEVYTYVATTTLDDEEMIFESFQGEFCSRDFIDAIEVSDATHTSMSVGDILIEVGTGRTLFCDFGDWKEV